MPADINLTSAERLAEEAEKLLKGYHDCDVSQTRFMRRSFELYPLLASTLLQMVARVRELEGERTECMSEIAALRAEMDEAAPQSGGES